MRMCWEWIFFPKTEYFLFPIGWKELLLFNKYLSIQLVLNYLNSHEWILRLPIEKLNRNFDLRFYFAITILRFEIQVIKQFETLHNPKGKIVIPVLFFKVL
jgi:hypothetical protein